MLNIHHNSNGVAHVNEVTLRWARLVLGWVTVSGFSSPGAGQLFRYVASHSGQLSLAIRCWVGTMSTSQRACRWQVKLCDPLVTHGPYLSTVRSLYIKCCINSAIHFLLYIDTSVP